jgi:hypothetical protein
MSEKCYHITPDDVCGDYGEEKYFKLLENGMVSTVSPAGKSVILRYEGADDIVVEEYDWEKDNYSF